MGGKRQNCTSIGGLLIAAEAPLACWKDKEGKLRPQHKQHGLGWKPAVVGGSELSTARTEKLSSICEDVSISQIDIGILTLAAFR